MSTTDRSTSRNRWPTRRSEAGVRPGIGCVARRGPRHACLWSLELESCAEQSPGRLRGGGFAWLGGHGNLRPRSYRNPLPHVHERHLRRLRCDLGPGLAEGGPAGRGRTPAADRGAHRPARDDPDSRQPSVRPPSRHLAGAVRDRGVQRRERKGRRERRPELRYCHLSRPRDLHGNGAHPAAAACLRFLRSPAGTPAERRSAERSRLTSGRRAHRCRPPPLVSRRRVTDQLGRRWWGFGFAGPYDLASGQEHLDSVSADRLDRDRHGPLHLADDRRGDRERHDQSTVTSTTTTYPCAGSATWTASQPPPAATPGRYCGFTIQGPSICLDVADERPRGHCASRSASSCAARPSG